MNENERHRFEHPLYISVGHTANSTQNTGIQRVTRSFARAAGELLDDVELLEWHKEPKCFKYLGEDLRAQFSEFGGPEFRSPDIENGYRHLRNGFPTCLFLFL